MKYFNECNNLEELKARFRKLCLELHPDTSGTDGSEFKAMFKEYEQVLKGGTFKFESDWHRDREYNFSDYIQTVLDKIIRLHNIKIEIIGTWIWVSGNTMAYKDYFKENGFFFSGKKKAWYFNGESKKKRTRNNYNLNDLRYKWSTYEVETEQGKEVTA